MMSTANSGRTLNRAQGGPTEVCKWIVHNCYQSLMTLYWTTLVKLWKARCLHIQTLTAVSRPFYGSARQAIATNIYQESSTFPGSKAHMFCSSRETPWFVCAPVLGRYHR